jgi:hypothetical protein
MRFFFTADILLGSSKGAAARQLGQYQRGAVGAAPHARSATAASRRTARAASHAAADAAPPPTRPTRRAEPRMAEMYPLAKPKARPPRPPCLGGEAG